jgi:hypothetical protein
MKLHELAYAARLFGEIPAGEVPPLKSLEQTPLLAHLEWLNQWGCRHIAKINHPAWARELERCLGALDSLLPSHSHDIRSLTKTQIDELGQAFDQVSSLWVRSSDGRKIHFGATAGSKTLHALRPNSLPMWDQEFRRRLGLGKNAAGYAGLIAWVRSEVESLCTDARRFSIGDSQIAEKVERHGASLVKLNDEYYWITWTENHKPPSPAQLCQWSKWAQPD